MNSTLKRLMLLSAALLLLLVAAGAGWLAGRESARPQGGDTARVGFCDEYFSDEVLPLNVWQKITVYGEAFHACPVRYTSGGLTVLTVNRDAYMQACGNLRPDLPPR
jgi:hypothetical protein